MQSSLIPERPLIISPTLAATIGLEEAVLLHVLSELIAHRPGTQREGLSWLQLDRQGLLDALPFWAWIDIRRVQKNLLELGLIKIDADTGREDSWWFAINHGSASGQPSEHSATNRQAAPPAQPRLRQKVQGSADYIAPDWQPGEEWLALCRQHGIPDDFSLSVVPRFVMYWRDRGESRFSWGNAFYRQVLREWREEQTRRGALDADTPMTADWWPHDDALAILRREDINEAFIEDAVPEFVLYHRERGTQAGAWNSKFIGHIRRQWARYRQLLRHDGQPRPISNDWQPDEDVFAMLRLAGIDEGFARRKVPEFVLYNRDTGQVQASWNTRFLQFIKYSWARRPEAAGLTQAPSTVMNKDARNYSDQQTAARSRQSLEAAYQRFTDRSWAD